jgi:hypothetical protein
MCPRTACIFDTHAYCQPRISVGTAFRRKDITKLGSHLIPAVISFLLSLFSFFNPAIQIIIRFFLFFFCFTSTFAFLCFTTFAFFCFTGFFSFLFFWQGFLFFGFFDSFTFRGLFFLFFNNLLSM